MEVQEHVRELTKDEERILRERLPPCPSCGALPGVKCVSTSKSVSRKRSAAKFFEYGVHIARRDLLPEYQ
jgi:hypothetical protein